jgi:prevent-host-death family protein
MTKVFDVAEAQAQFAELLSWAQAGHEVLIVSGDTPVARLVPEPIAAEKRAGGWCRGKIWVADDFDAPLPDSFWLGQE